MASKYANVGNGSSGRLVYTVTGNKHVIRAEHFEVMKGAIGNSGHFDVSSRWVPQLLK